ncbi:hypothetical protein [Scytonema sp. PCC 10023]|uniref:hypothetical protein n=1 Tax=Scytonema sp. PCC 10023 TaxID=1680591 RepID=UPI0039C6D249
MGDILRHQIEDYGEGLRIVYEFLAFLAFWQYASGTLREREIGLGLFGIFA